MLDRIDPIRTALYAGCLFLASLLPIALAVVSALLYLPALLGMVAAWAYLLIRYFREIRLDNIVEAAIAAAAIAGAASAPTLLIGLFAAMVLDASAGDVAIAVAFQFIVLFSIAFGIALHRQHRQQHALATGNGTTGGDRLDQLARIKQLHDDGALDDEAFERERSRILAGS